MTFPLIPLLALPMGAVSIVDERESGTLQYLLSNPVTKGEFFLGRAVGLLLATTSVIIIGFGAASVVVYTTGDLELLFGGDDHGLRGHAQRGDAGRSR